MANINPILFFKQSRDELRKVTWPSRQTTVQYTIVVIVGSLLVGLIIGFIDYIFGNGLKSIILH
jgi:preprotein translocase subunit SecE